LAVDFPGHGLSSKLGPGMFYHGINGAVLIRQLNEVFKWDKITLMGHSLGGITSYMFSTLHPELVDFVICLDGLVPLQNRKGVETISETIENFLKYDRQFRRPGHGPCYTMEQAAQLLHNGTRKSVDLDKCHYILKRNMKQCEEEPDKYYFDRDPRLKCGSLVTFNDEESYQLAHRATFPLLFIRPNKSPFDVKKEYMTKSMQILKDNCKNFEIHIVPGTHHVHLNQPEVFQHLIPDFIAKHDKLDRSGYDMPDDIKIKKNESTICKAKI